MRYLANPACLAALVLICLLSTFSGSPAVAEEEAAAWIQSSLGDLPETTSQVLLVAAEQPGDFTATLYVLEKRGGVWKKDLAPLPALIGSKGFAPPGEKREGDHRTPSGAFALKLAFGYGERIDSDMPYRQAEEEDIWVDDAESPDYNRWVRRDETSAASFEDMKRKDDRYKYGIVVEYNTDPVVKGAGSAIFIHVRGGEDIPTLGCVALAEEDILQVLAWLDPAKQPLIVMGTKDSLLAAAEPEVDLTSYDQDLAAFARLRSNLFRLVDEIGKRPDLFGPREADDPTLLRPEMRRQISALWYPLLDNYLALDALAEKYGEFYRLKDKQERKAAFHLARGIFLTQYRIALETLPLLERNPAVDTILNEGDPALGLPQGVYADFKYQYLNVAKAGRYAALEAVARAFGEAGDDRLWQWAGEDRRFILDAGKGPGPLMTIKNGLAVIERFGRTAWFPVQKNVAEWMGHTKVWRPHRYLIRPGQIDELADRLEPGDILLERREWYLTNVGIPGFWTHAALYIGSPEQRQAFSRNPDVKAWLAQAGAESIDDLIRQRYPQAWDNLQIPYQDGHAPRVIEAISPGVSLTSLHFSATCDSLAVLRPRLSPADRAAAVVRAMRYQGRPYDYSFDFVSDASLVCTELVLKSYLPGKGKKGLDLPLETVMGQTLTPANAFARQFDQTFGSDRQQMDLVVFLDGQEKEKLADESDLAAFRHSWQRPKWHILVQSINKGE